MDRRTTVKWVLATVAYGALAHARSAGEPLRALKGYGTDPDLLKTYHPGEVWPLTLSAPQRQLAAVLCDLVIPADEHSPAASTVGVVEFIDEWVSAPYPDCQRDRPIVLAGFEWLDAEAARRFGAEFVALTAPQRTAICDDICDASRAAPVKAEAARFFALYRDLTAGGFYSTPVGRKDLGYVGNVPLTHFEGPPAELLKKFNLLWNEATP
ncbi:MAG: gluconate 2-dehydrogenase subunit 3 family protein [Gammaproteobacteria bacterium]|nr:gluconate 2-dehydrogenase subunit 3 family protein [Gammaproteobacteria bacterium]